MVWALTGWRARADLAFIGLTYQRVEIEARKPLAAWPNVRNHASWTPHDLFLCDVVAENLANDYICSEFVALLLDTESKLRELSHLEAAAMNVRARNTWEEILRVFDMVYGDVSLPAQRIFSTALSKIFNYAGQSGFTSTLKQLNEVAQAGSSFALKLLLRMIWARDIKGVGDIETCIGLLKFSWDTGYAYIRLDALHMISSIAHPVLQHEGKAAEIVRYLQGLETHDILTSTALVHALSAYDALDPFVDVDSAVAEAARILADADLDQIIPDLPRRAAYFICNIFEEIYGNAYWHAYEGLTSSEKVKLLSLAAEDETGFSQEWVLSELWALKSQTALPVFRRFASEIPRNQSHLQGAIAAFVIAIAGCARFGDRSWDNVISPDLNERAWQHTRDLLFVSFANPENCEVPAGVVLQGVENQVKYAMASVLYHLKHSGFYLNQLALDWSLETRFPGWIRGILELSLCSREKLTSLFPRLPNEDLVAFIICELGEVGDLGSIAHLSKLADDPKYGADVITSIAKIRKRLEHKT